MHVEDTPKHVILTDGKLIILTTCQTNSLESVSHNMQYIGINQAQFNKIRDILSVTKNCI